MATYVPGFDYDIFLSYSHANDADRWVSTFRTKLEKRLNERVRGATFFWDAKSVQGNDELTPTLVDAIRKSAILVSIVSESYLDRPWCLKECREFIRANAEKGLKGRIFAVRYDDVSPAKFQKVVGEMIGYDFFAKGEDDKYVDVVEPESAAFKVKMNDLRMQIAKKLKELKDQPPPERSPAVFLAEPAPGLSETADQLTSYLRSLQYEVIRPGERFHEIESFESVFTAGLRRSQVFVQLLGRKFDPRDDDTVQSWDRWQYLQAQAEGLTTLRWFNKYDKSGNEINLQDLDADHREFVSQTGVWNCDDYRFREIIRNKIDTRFLDLQHNRPQPLVVLRSDRSDKNVAEDIGRKLRQMNCDALGVPDKDVTSLDEFAKRCPANAMIVVYRDCPGEWVIKQIQDVRRFLLTEFGRRWACGLWRDPSDMDEALSFWVDGLFVIDPPHPQRLQEFVTQLQTRLSGLERPL